MRTGRQTDAITLIPYQATNFLVQEQQYADLAAEVSAWRTRGAGRDMDSFLDNSLARAWHRNHPENRDNGTRSSDEVGG